MWETCEKNAECDTAADELAAAIQRTIDSWIGHRARGYIVGCNGPEVFPPEHPKLKSLTEARGELVIRRALLMDEVKQELSDGAVLILIRGWYWLLNDEGRARKVNCNSAKALIAQGGLDEWKAQAWTGDRAYAELRTKPWPSERSL